MNAVWMPFASALTSDAPSRVAVTVPIVYSAMNSAGSGCSRELLNGGDSRAAVRVQARVECGHRRREQRSEHEREADAQHDVRIEHEPPWGRLLEHRDDPQYTADDDRPGRMSGARAHLS